MIFKVERGREVICGEEGSITLLGTVYANVKFNMDAYYFIEEEKISDFYWSGSSPAHPLQYIT